MPDDYFKINPRGKILHKGAGFDDLTLARITWVLCMLLITISTFFRNLNANTANCQFDIKNKMNRKSEFTVLTISDECHHFYLTTKNSLIDSCSCLYRRYPQFSTQEQLQQLP